MNIKHDFVIVVFLWAVISIFCLAFTVNSLIKRIEILEAKVDFQWGVMIDVQEMQTKIEKGRKP